MIVKFKKLHKDAVLPSYAKENDGAMDLTAVTEGVFVDDGEYYAKDNYYYFIEYDTGIACEVPPGYVGLLLPRSSITKKQLFLGNSVGVLDAGYRDSIKFRFKIDRESTLNTLNLVNKYKRGERIGQLMIIPRPEIEPVWSDELSNSQRGLGGFGSSGT